MSLQGELATTLATLAKLAEQEVAARAQLAASEAELAGLQAAAEQVGFNGVGWSQVTGSGRRAYCGCRVGCMAALGVAPARPAMAPGWPPCPPDMYA